MSQDPARGVAARLSGAPLDIVKLAAAALMLLDHVNTALLKSAVPLLWRFGRIAFPLFCFVLACHLVRGLEPGRYVRTLLLVGILTQPLFAAAFSTDQANVLFTLGVGAVLAAALSAEAPWKQHLVLAAGVAAVFAVPIRTRTGMDFGMPGMLLPAALTLTLAGSRLHVTLAGSRLHGVWLVLLVFSLNAEARRGPDETWLSGASLDALFAGLGGLVVLALAAAFRGRPRFLPRYALHAFYPGHLLALIVLRSFGIGTAP